VVIEKSRYDEFVEAVKEVLASFYPQGAAASDSYSRIINQQHFQYVTKLGIAI